MDLNEVLIEAAKDGNMIVLKAALDKGADINARDENGWTALMWAKKNGHSEIVEYLKRRGAIEKEVPKIKEEDVPKIEEINLFPVEIGGKWGYIDKAGKIVINPQFDDAFDFSEGLAPVAIGDEWGYIDKGGKFVINPQFDGALVFSEGLAMVGIGDKFGYIDKAGNYIWNPTD